MVTTFERLAKVLKGFVKPANWIERAFAELVSAIGSVLPSVSNSDRGKFLGVNSSNNNLSWKAIRQVPDVESADKGNYLHANSETGALEWSAAGGSVDSDFFFVSFTYDENSNEWSADKTYNEITAALTDGSKVIAGKLGGFLVNYTGDSPEGYSFSGVDFGPASGGVSINLQKFAINSQNSITFTTTHGKLSYSEE